LRHGLEENFNDVPIVTGIPMENLPVIFWGQATIRMRKTNGVEDIDATSSAAVRQSACLPALVG
jgi:hypothetical protein